LLKSYETLVILPNSNISNGTNVFPVGRTVPVMSIAGTPIMQLQAGQQSDDVESKYKVKNTDVPRLCADDKVLQTEHAREATP
jgi:hypothetical protein